MSRAVIGKAFVLAVILLLALTATITVTVVAPQGSPPQISDIDFPSTIQADGNPVTGYIFFEDPDGDVVKVKFELVEGDRSSLQLSPGWEFDPQVKGQTEGVIEFQIAATTEGSFKLQAIIEDEAGNRSEPMEFSFEALRSEPLPALQVNPTQLEFRGQQGGSNPNFQTLTIANTGGGLLSWTATTDTSWIFLGAAQGTLAAGSSIEMRVFVSISGLTAGTHLGLITISAPGAERSPITITVTLILTASPRTVKVMLLGADHNPDALADAKDYLQATGRFQRVDVLDVEKTTPTLQQLMQYDAVIVWENELGGKGRFNDPVALGDVLADYVDRGGGVVIADNALLSEFKVRGRFFDGGYYAIKPGGKDSCHTNSFGKVLDPSHPIMQGVVEVRVGSCGNSLLDLGTLTPGSTTVAEWANGDILVAVKEINGVRRADINLVVASNRVPSCPGCWPFGPDNDIPRLFANALLWVGSSQQ